MAEAGVGVGKRDSPRASFHATTAKRPNGSEHIPNSIALVMIARGADEMDERWLRELQSAATFPLPFRVLFLLSSGVLAWATNLHGLHLHGIDGPSALQLDRSLPIIRSSTLKSAQRSLSYQPIYRLFFQCAAWCLSVWLAYRYLTLHHAEYVDVFKYLPAVGALGLVIGLVCPYNVLEVREREKFLSCVVFFRCFAFSSTNS